MSKNIDNLYIYTSNVLKPKIEIVNQNINSNLHTTSITGSLSNLINISFNSNKILINNENITTSDIDVFSLNYLSGLSESITTSFINSSNIINNSSNILINSINDIDTTLTTKYNTIDSNSSNYNSNIDIDITKKLENLNISNILNGTINKYIENNLLNTDLIVNGNVNVLNGFITSNNVISSSKTIANEDLHIVSSSSNTALTIQQNNNQNTVEIYGNTGTKFIINNSGNIGIGKNPTTSNSLEIFGDINSTGLYSNSLPFSYSGLSNIPLEFTPSAHSHTITDISGLTTILDSKQTIINSLTSNNDTITINSGLNLSSGYTFKEDNVELKLQSSIITTTTSETTNYWNEKTISIVDNGVNKELLTVPNSSDKYYAFTSTSGANSITFASDTICDILIVGGGGGGGGGSALSSGGGAGGLIYATNIIIPNNTYNIIIGKGGNGGVYTTSKAQNGQDTTAFGAIAFGGGAGQINTLTASNPPTGIIGGSGGGGAQLATTISTLGGAGGIATKGNLGTLLSSGTTYGNNGGMSYSWKAGVGSGGSGGGGGATSSGGNGVNSSSGAGGNGGNGFPCSITGIEYYFAGGGGGSSISGTSGSGGIGGGGGGGTGGGTLGSGGGSAFLNTSGSTGSRIISGSTYKGGDAAPNSGGGGGASCSTGLNSVNIGGNGGSGIVIIRIKQQTYPSNITYASTSIDANSLVLRNYSSNIIPNGTLSQPISYDVVNSAFVYEFYPGSNYVSFPYDTTCDLLLVGGGGSGGTSLGTGGNSGNVIYSTDVIVPAGNYNIIVGEGGTYGKDGGDTTAFGATSKGGRGIIAKIPSGIKASVPPQPVIGNSSYVYYAFTTNGSITFSNDTICDILLVGGGGGGSGQHGGGGGAGKLILFNQVIIPSNTYTINIGAGGTCTTAGGVGGKGGNTQILLNSEILCYAEGGGGSGNTDASLLRNGGSGAGGDSYLTPYANGISNDYIPVLFSQYGIALGNDGGTYSRGTTAGHGGGGGGAGEKGQAASGNSANTGYGGKGGDGVYIVNGINLNNTFNLSANGLGVKDVTTGNYYLAGGGGGGTWGKDTIRGFGGKGGGGDGGAGSTSEPGNNGSDAIPNTGSGGGGGGDYSGNKGGAGGSGIVIIRVPVDDVIYEENGGVYRLNDNNIIDNNAVILNKFDTARQNLIAWYKFDGDFTDSSGNGNHLTNTTSSFDTTNKKQGTSSILFPTTQDGLVTFPTSVHPYNIWNASSYGITFSIWFRYVAQTGTWGRLLDFQSAASNDNGFFISVKATPGSLTNYVGLHFRTNTTTFNYSNWDTTAGKPLDGNWHHIVWSINKSGVWTIYYDGVNLNCGKTASPLNITTYNIRYIADSAYPENASFSGNMDDFRIYNKALSKDEVEYIYSTTNTKAGLLPYATSPAILYNNLRLWYKFSGKLGTIDSSIYSLNATATGTPVISDGIIKITKDNYLQLPSNVIDFNNDITICFWFRFDNGLANGRVFDFSVIQNKTSHANCITMCRNGTLGLFYLIMDTLAVSIELGHTTSGQMIHFSWVIKKNGIWNIYKNGILLDTHQGVYPITNIYTYSYLGKSGFNGEFANDNQISLKDFRIYNRSLTEDEIYNIYNQVTTTSLVAYSPTPFIYNYDFYNDTTNMIAWYKFDGDFTDSSVNGNHLTNTTSSFDTTNKIQGKSSILFPTTQNGLVTFPSGVHPYNIWNTSSSGITFSIWFRYVTQAGTWGRLLDFQSAASNTNGFLIGIKGSPSIGLYFQTNTTTFSYSDHGTTAGKPLDGNWHHIVWSINKSGVWTIYYDGVNLNAGKTASPLNITTYNIRYMADSSYPSDASFSGNMDDFRIYNKTLSKEEVALLYYSSSYYGYNLAKFYNDTTDMYAWYKFDGDLTDSSGNEINAVLKNGAISYDTSIIKIGVSSLSFNGSTSYSCTPPTDTDPFNSNTISVSVWHYSTTSTTSFQSILSTRPSVANLYGWMIYIFPSGNNNVLSIQYGTSTTWDGVETAFQITPNSTWRHICFTVDENKFMTVYVNGILVGSKLLSNFVVNSANILYIGAHQGGSTHYVTNGTKLDDVRIYNRALTPSEIDIIYNQYIIDEPLESFYNNTNDMYVWYKFDENFIDSSGNGNNATAFNTPTFDSTVNKDGTSAISFSGGAAGSTTSSYLTVPGTNFSLWDGFTMSCWVYFEDNASSGRIIDFANGQANNNILLSRQGTSNKLEVNVMNGSTKYYAITSNDVIVLNTWMHVAWVITKVPLYVLYVNGVAQQFSSQNFIYPNNVILNNCYIAKSHWSVDAYFKGKIDDFRIYNRALTPSEVALLANRFGGGGGSVATPGTFTTSGGIGGDALIIPMRYNESFAKGGDGFRYNTLSTTQGIGYGGTGSTSLIYNPGGRGTVIIRIPYQPYIIDADKYNQEPTQIPGTNDFYYAFTSTTGTNSITFRHDTLCDVLIVGGGGSGGSKIGGGGGGGAVLHASGVNIPANTYIITVGNGGQSVGANGNDSIAFGATVKGGGGGADITWPATANGISGGSGGGGHASGVGTTPAIGGTSTANILGIIGSILSSGTVTIYGNEGGSGVVQNPSSAPISSGGGGGAGTSGTNGATGTDTTLANGGNGIPINIDGNNYYWGGGGAGGSYKYNGGVGGLGGGGGAGATDGGSAGSGGGIAITSGNSGSGGTGGAGGANTGGGGGGSGHNITTAGKGGSGIVIIRWTIPGAYTTNEKTNGGVYVDKGGISTVSGDITTYGGNIITNNFTINNDIVLNTLGYTDKQWKIYGNNDNQFDLSFDRSNDTGNMWLTQAKIRGNGGTKGYVNFTGMHHCKASTPELYDDKYIGYIVSSTKQYQSMNSIYDSSNIQRNINKNAWDALPIVALSTEKDKKVFGIIAKVEDDYSQSREEVSGNIVNYFEKKSHDRRLHIAGVGEGGIWISNYNGVIESGDYITTSPIPGIGMKQDDDLVHGYTVAKATMDCDFNPKKIPVKILTKIGEDYDKNTDGNYIYSDLLDDNGEVIYEDEYEIKYITLDGTIIDASDASDVYKIAFIGCSYTCS